MTKIEKMSDHDLLIRLDTKVDQLSLDLKNQSEGISQNISKHELKIAAQDLRLTETELWIHDFKQTYKFGVGIIVAISAVITFILTVILNIANIIHLK